jgi:hypothetical protein
MLHTFGIVGFPISFFPALVQGDGAVSITGRLPWQLHYWRALFASVGVLLQQEALIAFLDYFDLDWLLRHLSWKLGCGRASINK